MKKQSTQAPAAPAIKDLLGLTKEEQVIKDVHHMLLDGRPMSALDCIHKYQMWKLLSAQESK